MAASRKIFLRRYQLLAGVYLIACGFGHTLWAQQTQQAGATPFVITSIQFSGNRRIQNATLQARIFSRVGDPFTIEGVRRDFQALWNTQFFEDVRLEVENDPKNPYGKILVFYVTERPIIRRIEYKGNKSVSESDILDRFKDRKVGLSVESQFDPTKIKRAEVVLKELLAEHGRQFAKVTPTFERIAATNAVKLVFNINEGPKVKVGELKIEGNKAFSQRKIIRSMRHDRPYAIPLGITEIPVLSKTYDRQKLDEDLEIGIRGLYQDHGYFKVLVKDPALKTIDVNKSGIPGPWPLVGSKHGKQTNITVQIEEGAQYRMGKLTFRSADPEQGLVFKQDALTRVFPLKEGDILSAEKIRKGLDTFKKLYGQYGYIDFTATPFTEVDDARKVVDMRMDLDQQKPFYVRRIEFTGNTTTRDKVIRRELLIDEGQLFDNQRWELSLLRLNQLNYFDTIKPENAEIKRNQKAGTVDIKLKVKEKGKQSISFSGGVSGVAGSFVGLSYQTNNFLGLGETLTFSAEIGDRQKNILFGFTEPYLFDRPIASGFTVFKNRFNYNQARETGILVGQQVALNPALQQNYATDSEGFTIFASYPLRRFSWTRVGITYGFTTTDITAFSQSASLLFQLVQFRSLAGPSALKGIRSSKISPTITYNTIDNPQNPTHGKSYFYGFSLEGGPLQGNVNTFSNTFTAEYFRPHYKKRNVIGMRLLTSMISGYGGKDVPPFNRFYLGGENDIRGFDFYTISPYVPVPNVAVQNITYLDPRIIGSNGQPTAVSIPVNTVTFFANRPGGDFQLVANVDYRIPIAGPVSVALFNDLGINGLIRKSQLHLDPTALAPLQQQYPNTDFPGLKISSNLPVLANNFTPHTSSGVELVVQLPIVNAPFRFYYAYNFLRQASTITGPTNACSTAGGTIPVTLNCGGGFFLSDAQKASLTQEIYQTQIAPQLNTFLQQSVQRYPSGLIEPKHTFRFTVGRTF
jgi:outer membrane protein insertion porin family